MTNDQKAQITTEIRRLVAMTSGEKIAKKAGVSGATISQMLNNNWELINDKMWRKVKIKLKIDLDWNIAPTTNTLEIMHMLKEAQARGESFAISDKAGFGKSETYKHYARTNPEVVYVECKTYWNTKTYIKAIANACGLNDLGTTEELVERVVNYLAGLDTPLVIIDQIDKLKDGAWDFFIDFYNDLGDNCAFCLSGVPAFEKRLLRGVSRDRSGYFEVWSRIGCRFFKLKDITPTDVAEICKANGLTDAVLIEMIYDKCNNDLRRVRKDIKNYYNRLKNAS
ncbi:AAA family ATPase [Flavobacterium covae]|uniref:AAA family ATPase n=1 Tax=Flavobacterium covae TaxID=2906076 RepID=UPI000745E457|nr:AAA family ATPase [Flavobacterium covae]AMA49437.1 hypothetical protein AWN65_08190 [Flavobacterium covae]MCJ1808956.1 ATP-binding protein [Flavobacterium covae]